MQRILKRQYLGKYLCCSKVNPPTIAGFALQSSDRHVLEVKELILQYNETPFWSQDTLKGDFL